MDSKVKALLFGGIIGAIVGVLGGMMYYNANVHVIEEGTEELSPPDAGTALKLGLSVLGFLRLIAE